MHAHETQYLNSEEKKEKFIEAIQELVDFIQKLKSEPTTEIDLNYVNDRISRVVLAANQKSLEYKGNLYKLEQNHKDYYFHAWLAAQYSNFATTVNRLLTDFPPTGSTRLSTFNAWTSTMVKDLQDLIKRRRAKWPRPN